MTEVTQPNMPRMDPELGLVWPVMITVAGLPPEEIGVVAGGHGPEHAMDDLALLLHEWADMISANKATALATAAEILAGVPAGARVPTPDPDFVLVEAQAVRSAYAEWSTEAAEWKRAHPDE